MRNKLNGILAFLLLLALANMSSQAQSGISGALAGTVNVIQLTIAH